MSDRVKNMLNELKYDKMMLLAENKRLKALRPVSSSMDDDIHVVWRQLKMLKKEKEKDVESLKKKMILAYISWCISCVIFVIIYMM